MPKNRLSINENRKLRLVIATYSPGECSPVAITTHPLINVPTVAASSIDPISRSS